MPASSTSISSWPVSDRRRDLVNGNSISDHVGETVRTPAAEMSEAELQAAEAVIARGRRAFLEVGAALLAIQRCRGYVLRGYARFEDYVEQQWGFGRTSAYWHIDAARVAGNVQRVGPNSGSLPNRIMRFALSAGRRPLFHLQIMEIHCFGSTGLRAIDLRMNILKNIFKSG